MTHPHAPPDPDSRDPAFLRTFCSTLLALLAAVALLNLVADPLGVFGTGLVPPVLVQDRDEKAARYRALVPPDVVVLGSSRSRVMPASCLARGLGRQTGFNFALSGAGTEDLVAVARFIRSSGVGASPVYVVGIEPEMFQGDGGTRPALLASRMLAPFGPGARRQSRLSAAIPDLFGWQASGAALSSLRAHILGQAPADSGPILEADGREVHAAAEAAWREGRYDGTERVAASLVGSVSRYQRFVGLDPARVGYFDEFLDEANRAGATVVAFIPPVHPALEQAAAATSREARTAELIALLRLEAARGRLRYVETRDLTALEADPRAYLDALHFLAPVASAVADAITGAADRCAVQ